MEVGLHNSRNHDELCWGFVTKLIAGIRVPNAEIGYVDAEKRMKLYRISD
jgi:hypothetical protein